MDAAELASTYGSPLYTYELASIRTAYGMLRKALPTPSHLYYSLKANPHPKIVSQLVQLGCRCEVSSIGELRIALQNYEHTGDYAQILYTGPGKAREAIRFAIEQGVKVFSVESLQEIAKTTAVARELRTPIELVLRINPDRSLPGPALSMTGLPSQFGIDADAILRDTSSYCSSPYARIIGYHIYLGTNITSPEKLLQMFLIAIQQAAALAQAQKIEPTFLDLGGGFGHEFAAPGELLDFAPLKEPLQAALDEFFPGWRAGSPCIVFEAGRYLTAACGSLICTVEDVKVSKNQTFVILDTGIHHLGGMSGLNRLLRARITFIPQKKITPQNVLENVSIMGPLCTPLDCLARGVHIAQVTPGDVLTVPNVGAYGLTASLLGFLSHDTPVEVILDGGMITHVSRIQLQRQTIG